MTLRRTLDEVRTQHSAKDYVFHLERLEPFDLAIGSLGVTYRSFVATCGNSAAAAQEATATLTTKVREDCVALALGTPVSIEQFQSSASKQALNACGETHWSNQAPWLRSRAASEAIGPLNTQCRDLRHQKHDIQQAFCNSPT